MRRFYSIDQYRERVSALRQARSDIAFSTDFIVGFPGETEEDFLQTLALAEEIRYDNVYAFLYSPRPGTSAAEREDLTPAAVKLERLSRLQKLSQRVSCELHASEVGQVRQILIEGPSKKDRSRLTGRTSQNVPCHLDPAESQNLRAGDLVQVHIVSSALTHLSGRLAPQSSKSEVHSEAR
jgi:tRNA-2-methylthio-N6-dimethylallyladenosine synthase